MYDHREGPDQTTREAGEETVAGRTSRLERRLRDLEGRQHRTEPISVLGLLSTDELRRALALTQRAEVMPNGEVRNPAAFREATLEELEALERWRRLSGEPLDHLELAEEFLDRMGNARGWRSPQALEAALLLKRLELPDESPWYVGKTAEAVVSLYAELEEHDAGRGGASAHPHVRGAIRRLERLQEIDRLAPESGPAGSDLEGEVRIEAGEIRQRAREKQEENDSGTNAGHSQDAEKRPFKEEEETPASTRRSWWREFFGID